MTITFAVREAVREAVETAEIERIEVDGKTLPGGVTFTVAARERLQRVVNTPDRLNQAVAACTEMMMRNITAEGIALAKSALLLRDRLPTMRPTSQALVMDPDGTLHAIDSPE